MQILDDLDRCEMDSWGNSIMIDSSVLLKQEARSSSESDDEKDRVEGLKRD